MRTAAKKELQFVSEELSSVETELMSGRSDAESGTFQKNLVVWKLRRKLYSNRWNIRFRRT